MNDKTQLSDEDRQKLIDAMANVTEIVSKVITGVTEGMLPMIEAYNSLPQPLKEALAAAQVKKHLEDSLQTVPIRTIGEAEDPDKPGRVLEIMATIEQYQLGKTTIKEAAEEIDKRYMK